MDRLNASNIQYLNSPFEVSLRLLCIFAANDGKSYDLDQLSFFDYMITRLHDFSDMNESLHAESPYKQNEMPSKYEVIKKAVLILLQKELITVDYNPNGISYRAGGNCQFIAEYFKTTYAAKLKANILRVNKLIEEKGFDYYKEFLDLSNSEQLSNYPNESLLRGINYET